MTYTAIVESCVDSIAHYSSEVWGFKGYEATIKMYLRAARFYLGLPKNAPIPAIMADIDWLEPAYKTQIKMIRQYHRILKMEDSRLPKVILLWDYKFSELNENVQTWSKEIRAIFQSYDLGYFSDNLSLFQLKDTIGTLQAKMKLKQTTDIKNKCHSKPQLRTYVKIKNFDQKPCFLTKPLSFRQRKFLTKFCTSCLELRICTGRYLQLPEVSRVCLVTPACRTLSLVETESHFLLQCSGYNDLRQSWLEKLELPDNFSERSEADQISLLVNTPEYVKPTAQFIIDAFELRSKLLYLANN